MTQMTNTLQYLALAMGLFKLIFKMPWHIFEAYHAPICGSAYETRLAPSQVNARVSLLKRACALLRDAAIGTRFQGPKTTGDL